MVMTMGAGVLSHPRSPTSIVAEFDSLKACEEASLKVQKAAGKSAEIVVCTPKNK
jgi:hypothetical protein